MSDRDPMNQELDDLRAENEGLRHEIAKLTATQAPYNPFQQERVVREEELVKLREENDKMRHEIANRDLTREIQRDIWAKEVELSALRSQLASAWGTLR